MNFAVNSKIADVKVKDGTRNAILGLLALGDENCAGTDIKEEDSSLFVDEELETKKTTETVSTRTKVEELNGQPKPVIKKDTETHQAEKTEEEIKAEKEKKKAEKRKKREEWKKNNPLSRAWRKVAKAATDLVSPEGE